MANNAKQIQLIQPGEWWEEAWDGMPEYVSEDLTPFKSIFVHFENREAMRLFADLVGQTITLKTKAIWHPKAEIGRFANKRYVERPSILYPGRNAPK